MSRFQRFLKAARHMFGAYKPIRRPAFYVDDCLVSNQIRAASKLPVNSIKPLTAGELEARVRMARDFVGTEPIDFDKGLPNG